MDTRLLLKEKQYELLKNKRTAKFKHSINDPLINPLIAKKKIGKKPTQAIKQPLKTSANNILSRMSKMPTANKAQ